MASNRPLKTLPPELLTLTFSFVDDQKTLYNIIQCSRAFRDLATAFLYKNITLKKNAHWRINDSLRILAQACSSNPQLAQNTLSLKLSADDDLTPSATMRTEQRHQAGADWPLTISQENSTFFESIVNQMTKLEILDVEIDRNDHIFSYLETQLIMKKERDHVDFPSQKSIFLTYTRGLAHEVRIGSGWIDSIKALCLRSMAVHGNSFLIPLVPKSLNIAHLDFRACEIDSGLLGRVFAACKSLKTLIFVENKMEVRLMGILLPFHALVEVCHTDGAYQMLVENLQSSVQSVWLDHGRSIDHSEKYSFREFPNLKRLRVREHKLVNKSIQEHRLPVSLEELYLIDCHFSTSCLHRFLEGCLHAKEKGTLPALKLITLEVNVQLRILWSTRDMNGKNAQGRRALRFVANAKKQGVKIVIKFESEDSSEVWP